MPSSRFVVAKPADIAEVSELEARYGLRPVWIMPEGTTADAVRAGMRRLADVAVQHAWNLSPRLHVLIWGDERGR